jgi:tripartite-type tricarboxylate transporter receptor subunit TctC
MKLAPLASTPRGVSRRAVLAGAAGAAALSVLRPARAQAFPSRAVTLICPWPAGGSTDRHMRALAELAGKNLGQSVVVEKAT